MSEATRRKRDVVTRLQKALKDRGLVIIVGAGVTLSATAGDSGTPLSRITWKGLIRNGLDYLVTEGYVEASQKRMIRAYDMLEESDGDSLLDAANILSDQLKRHRQLPTWLESVFDNLHQEVRHPAILEALKALHEKGATLLTTNYDDVLEHYCGLRHIGRSNRDEVLKFKRGDVNGVFHIHGSYHDPHEVVLDTTDYYQVTHSDEVQSVLKNFLEFKTILFVGCGSGLEDPNFAALLEWASAQQENIPNRHCLLMREGDVLNCPLLVRFKYGREYKDLIPCLEGILDAQIEGYEARPAIQSRITSAQKEHETGSSMLSSAPPRSRDDFKIAILCALVREADAVQLVFDKFWGDHGKRYGKATGDPNAYTTGVIGRHNVVLAHLGGMGSVAASVAAAGLRGSFSGIKLALVVGICGAVPSYGHGSNKTEIWLGDAIISTAVIHYDYGRQYPGNFKRKTALEDTLGRASSDIRSLVSQLQTHHYREKLRRDVAMYLERLQQKHEAKYPGPTLDILHGAACVHKHRDGAVSCDKCKDGDDPCPRYCDELKCDDVIRQRVISCELCKDVKGLGDISHREYGEQIFDVYDSKASVRQQATFQHLPISKPFHLHDPGIHFGRFGSANKVMKSGEDRDALAKDEAIIALEMEAMGVWELFPTIVIKSACDYADSHKNKDWQDYAAITAAACMRAVLEEWDVDEPFSTQG